MTSGPPRTHLPAGVTSAFFLVLGVSQSVVGAGQWERDFVVVFAALGVMLATLLVVLLVTYVPLPHFRRLRVPPPSLKRRFLLIPLALTGGIALPWTVLLVSPFGLRVTACIVMATAVVAAVLLSIPAIRLARGSTA